MIRKIRDTIKKYQMLQRGDRVVVAVSGGPDSVALLNVLSLMAEEHRLSLIVAHLNHGLRGPEACAEAQFVRELSESLGYPFEEKTLDLQSPDHKKCGSWEEMAREARYRFLKEVAQRHQAQKIALGHHRLDQAETVLMNILRGTGPDGLKGMLPVRDRLYIRPLLEVSKSDVLAFLKDRGLSYVIDSSNTSDRYLRNRIRHRLLPELLDHYNPALVEGLNRMAEIMRREDDYMEAIAEGLLRRWDIQQADQEYRLPLPDLITLHTALQYRIVKTLLERVAPDGPGISYRHIRSVVDLIHQGRPSGGVSLPSGAAAKREYDSLLISRKLLPSPAPFFYEVRIPGRVAVQEATMVVDFAWTDRRAVDFRRQACAYLDADQIMIPLCLRNFRAGDRFQPLGMGGTKKIKSLFIDRKIPLHRRKTIPLLTDQQSVIWIAGMGLSERVKISEHTTKVLKIEIV